jgi:sugar phosphate isomerase/epimerase
MSRVNLAWLYAITRYGYPPPIDNMFRVVDDAVRLGFKAIELEVVGERNLREIEEHRKELKDYIVDKGLAVVNVAAIFRELLSPDENIRSKALEWFAKTANLALYFNAPMVQIDTFTPPIDFIGAKPYSTAIVFGEKYRVRIPPNFSWRSFWRMLVEVIKRCSFVARDHGLLLSIEPRIGETISNSDAMLRLLDEVNEDNLGAVLDTGHLHAAKELIPLSIEKLGEKILYVHISDNDGRDNYHWSPGKGTIDWESVFEGLKRHRFKGYIAIDVGGQDIKDRLDEEVIEAKKFVEEMGKKYSLW